jgi:site-specific DNA recombinase
MDAGDNGATLVRPALERLRDLVAAGAVERLYVPSPDRLARRYAYQVLLVDEFQRVGVAVIFLTRELGRSLEDDLLLQGQGMMAEYERAKIIERHRRGKLHASRSGSVNVMGGLRMGIAMSPNMREAGKRAMKFIRRKLAWCSKSLIGSAASD